MLTDQACPLKSIAPKRASTSKPNMPGRTTEQLLVLDAGGRVVVVDSDGKHFSMKHMIHPKCYVVATEFWPYSPQYWINLATYLLKDFNTHFLVP